MPGPSLPIYELGGPPPSETPPPSPELETFLRALESPRGIEIETTSPEAACALRFKLYRARNRTSRSSPVLGARLAQLVLTLHGSAVRIKKQPEICIRDL